MFLPVYAALAAAFVFYLGIPLVGAFSLRGQWRRFRARFAELRRAPLLRYRDVAGAEAAGDLVLGRFRLYGRVEALEGSDRLWLRGEGVSAVVDLRASPLYVLAEAERGEAARVERLDWQSVPALAAGTPMLAAGLVVLQAGKPVFVEAPGESLLAVSHDCEDSVLASSLVAGARAANEYWTPMSRLSIAAGLVATSLILLLASGRTPFSTVKGMTFLIGVLPILPLAPPGLLLFLQYRRLWRRALERRAFRDLLRMPLELFPELGREGGEAAMPDGGRYRARRLAEGEEAPAGALALGPASGATAGRWIFYAEGTNDPALETVLTNGDPLELAKAASRDAALSALASTALLGLGLLANYALGVIVWQRVP